MEAKRAESKYAVIKKQLYLIQSIEPESKTKSAAIIQGIAS